MGKGIAGLAGLLAQFQRTSAGLSTGDMVAIIGAVLVLLVVLVVVRVLVVRRRLRRASREGRRVSGQQTGVDPVTSFSRDGKPSDPINVKLIGSRGQLATAFTEAGWYRADEIDLVTSVRISFDSVLGRKYSTAPVSNLFLYGRKEDFAFERPGSSVRERDHVRLWDTGARSEGRRIWVGGATHDIAVEISKVTHLPTHRIAGDVDAERTNVMNTLIESGWVIAEGWEADFPGPSVQTNSLGDQYHTDGRRAVLTLADVAVFAPITTHVRGPLGLRIATLFGRVLRGRLPKAGLERAAKLLAERAAREHARAKV